MNILSHGLTAAELKIVCHDVNFLSAKLVYRELEVVNAAECTGTFVTAENFGLAQRHSGCFILQLNFIPRI